MGPEASMDKRLILARHLVELTRSDKLQWATRDAVMESDPCSEAAVGDIYFRLIGYAFGPYRLIVRQKYPSGHGFKKLADINGPSVQEVLATLHNTVHEKTDGVTCANIISILEGL